MYGSHAVANRPEFFGAANAHCRAKINVTFPFTHTTDDDERARVARSPRSPPRKTSPVIDFVNNGKDNFCRDISQEFVIRTTTFSILARDIPLLIKHVA